MMSQQLGGSQSFDASSSSSDDEQASRNVRLGLALVNESSSSSGSASPFSSSTSSSSSSASSSSSDSESDSDSEDQEGVSRFQERARVGSAQNNVAGFTSPPAVAQPVATMPPQPPLAPAPALPSASTGPPRPTLFKAPTYDGFAHRNSAGNSNANLAVAVGNNSVGATGSGTTDSSDGGDGGNDNHDASVSKRGQKLLAGALALWRGQTLLHGVLSMDEGETVQSDARRHHGHNRPVAPAQVTQGVAQAFKARAAASRWRDKVIAEKEAAKDSPLVRHQATTSTTSSSPCTSGAVGGDDRSSGACDGGRRGSLLTERNKKFHTGDERRRAVAKQRWNHVRRMVTSGSCALQQNSLRTLSKNVRTELQAASYTVTVAPGPTGILLENVVITDKDAQSSDGPSSPHANYRMLLSADSTDSVTAPSQPKTALVVRCPFGWSSNPLAEKIIIGSHLQEVDSVNVSDMAVEEFAAFMQKCSHRARTLRFTPPPEQHLDLAVSRNVRSSSVEEMMAAHRRKASLDAMDDAAPSRLPDSAHGSLTNLHSLTSAAVAGLAAEKFKRLKKVGTTLANDVRRDGLKMGSRKVKDRISTSQDHNGRSRSSSIAHKIRHAAMAKRRQEEEVQLSEFVNPHSNNKVTKFAMENAISEATLGSIPIFEGIDEGARDELLCCVSNMEVIENQIVCKQGEQGDCMYFVSSGSLSVYVDRKLVHTMRVEHGSHVPVYFGQLALLSKNRTRTATIRANEYCRLQVLHRRDFKSILRKYPEFAAKVAAREAQGHKFVMSPAKTEQKRRLTLNLNNCKTFSLPKDKDPASSVQVSNDTDQALGPAPQSHPALMSAPSVSVGAGPHFGVSLEHLTAVGMIVSGYEARIPSVLQLMREELVVRGGFFAEGIFRVQAEATACRAAEAVINRGGNFAEHFSAQIGPHGDDVHVIAQMIKTFFRKLPDPLYNALHLSRSSFEEMVKLTPEQLTQRVEAFFEPCRSVLYWLLDLLVDVANLQKRNRMSPDNLSIVFAPNLFFFSPVANDPLDTAQVVHLVSKFTSALIIARRDCGKRQTASPGTVRYMDEPENPPTWEASNSMDSSKISPGDVATAPVDADVQNLCHILEE